MSNRGSNVRLSLFAVALLVPLGLIAALVLALDEGQEELAQDVMAGPERQGGGADAAAGGDEGRAAARPRLVRIGTFDQPLYVTAPPGDRRRIFVVEQPGRIRVIDRGRVQGRPFLDISSRVVSGGEQGLLSMAFAPDYARSGRFYVNFTDRNGDTRVQEFRRSRGSRNRADSGSARPILFQRQPYANHNGGLVLLGPDGHLYVGMGDGGSGGDPENRAQDLETLLGKLLRIDPKRSGAGHTSPRSNPFAGGRAGRNEIYALGLRNPWRFSFDRATGDLYIGDVGQSAREEISHVRRGQGRGVNFGWSCFEGEQRFDRSRSCPGARGPVLDFGRGNGECSVTGGVVVRDPALPSLAGRYLYGDYCRGQVRSFKVSNGRATGDRPLGVRRVEELSSFGEDASGRVYVTSLAGPVYRLR
jgi:glucose/arabinose dehydrogenase